MFSLFSSETVDHLRESVITSKGMINNKAIITVINTKIIHDSNNTIYNQRDHVVT